MRLVKRLALLAIVLLEVGCGLPDAYYVYPPAIGTAATPTTPIFVINGTSRSQDILVTFWGYELYYKFYGANDATLTADENYGSPNYTTANLISSGFHRVCLGPGNVTGLTPDTNVGSASAPLINMHVIDPPSVGSNYQINIIFDDSNPPALGFLSLGQPTAPVSYYEYIPAAQTVPTFGMEVRRYVVLPAIVGGNACKTFASNYYYNSMGFTNYDSTADVDVQSPSSLWPAVSSNGGLIYIIIYAVSYGQAQDGSFQTSSPVYLGYTQLQVMN
jgi:hypothetical protein